MLIYLAMGLAGGLLAGMLGIGGGLLFIVILPSALVSFGAGPDDLPEAVIANSLYATFFSALGATVTHLLQRRSGAHHILWVGIPAAFIAALSLHYIASAAWFSRALFLNIVIVLLLVLLVRSFVHLMSKKTVSSIKEEPIIDKAPYIVSGMGAGFISSLSGLGGGIIVVPAMRYWARQPMLQANFISSGTIVISSAGAAAAALLAPDLQIDTPAWGLIVPAISTPLAIGVLAGSPVGVWVSKRLPDKALTAFYCLFLVIVLVRKVIEAGYLK